MTFTKDLCAGHLGKKVQVYGYDFEFLGGPNPPREHIGVLTGIHYQLWTLDHLPATNTQRIVELYIDDNRVSVELDTPVLISERTAQNG